MKTQDRAKELAAAHWDYTGGLLKVAQYDAEVLALAEFLYKAAAVHFYGHALEDCQNGMFGIFGADIDEVALEAELDRSCGNAAANAEHATRTKDLFTRGCPTCLDAAACTKTMATDRNGKCLYHRLRNGSLCAYCHRPPMCSGDYPVTTDGGCEGYISALRENMLDAKQETRLPDMGCMNTDCCDQNPRYLRNCGAFLPGAMRQCLGYTTAKQEAPTTAVLPLDFTLPSIALKCTAEEAHRKYCEENAEWLNADTGSMDELVERWDCLQALRTYAERGGGVTFCQNEEKYICHDLTAYHAKGRDAMGAKAACLLKNAERGYYSPGVCAAIIASKGHRFQPLDEMGVI